MGIVELVAPLKGVKMTKFKRCIAVGDIHGCPKTARKLIEMINPTEDDQLIFVGDYIDRGQDSKGVVDMLIELKEKFPNTVFLKGNHEDMMLQGLGDMASGKTFRMSERNWYDTWLLNGGVSTIRSYLGGELPDADMREVMIKDPFAFLSDGHREFFESLQVKYETDTHFFVHAGVDPYEDLSNQDDEMMIWIRDLFLESTIDYGKIVVHGHTFLPHPMIKPNRIGIDTGCVFGGNLTAIDVYTQELFQVKLVDEERTRSSFL